MVAILNDLEAEGYVCRERDPSDRRRNSITITRSGRAALNRFDRVIAVAQDVVLGSLSPGDRKKLVQLLEQLVATPSRATVTTNK
jgi:DNA-binding MarR family transcriptional regulator